MLRRVLDRLQQRKVDSGTASSPRHRLLTDCQVTLLVRETILLRRTYVAAARETSYSRFFTRAD